MCESVSQHLACSLTGDWFPGLEDKPCLIPLDVSYPGRQCVWNSTHKAGHRDPHLLQRHWDGGRGNRWLGQCDLSYQTRQGKTQTAVKGLQGAILNPQHSALPLPSPSLYRLHAPSSRGGHDLTCPLSPVFAGRVFISKMFLRISTTCDDMGIKKKIKGLF